MKKLTKYNRVAGYLEQIFRLMNQDFFESALSIPVITIQSTPTAYGHVTVGEVWMEDGKTMRKELNIGAGTLARPIEDVCATMMHEMVHLYNAKMGIKDTSRGLTYHNKKFAAAAEARGLVIEHDPKIGYSITKPGEKLLDWVIENDLVDIKINRMEMYGIAPIGGNGSKGGSEPKPKKPSSTRKYQCPKCGCSIRATKDVNIMCMDCNEKMLKA